MAKILLVVSSAKTIELKRDKAFPTGYFADEVIKPYDKFIAEGLEVVAATPDGVTPQPAPYGLKPFFHYPDIDKDFLTQVMRSFAPDFDDIRITLHQLTELDLIAARKVFQALVEKGLDRDTAWSLVKQAARTAWREDRNFIEVLSTNPGVSDKLSREQLQNLADEVMAESAALAEQRAARLKSIDTLEHPLNLSQLSDAEILSFDAVFFPGGHGPMVDLYADPNVGRVLQLFQHHNKLVTAVCHGPAAFLAAGTGPEGVWIFDGYKMVAFTDEEEDQTPYGLLGVSWNLETALKNQGAIFDDGDAPWVSHVVVDRNMVTGQNPGSSEAVAEAILKKLGVAAR